MYLKSCRPGCRAIKRLLAVAAYLIAIHVGASILLTGMGLLLAYPEQLILTEVLSFQWLAAGWMYQIFGVLCYLMVAFILSSFLGMGDTDESGDDGSLGLYSHHWDD